MNDKTAYQIIQSVFIAADPVEVYETITTAEKWDRFFTTGMELDPRPGGVCNFRWENWGPDLVSHESPGKVFEVEPPRLFVFEWGGPGRKTVARFEIEPKYDGSILTMMEYGYPDTEEGSQYMIECAAHWGELLTLIKFYIEFGETYRSPQA